MSLFSTGPSSTARPCIAPTSRTNMIGAEAASQLVDVLTDFCGVAPRTQTSARVIEPGALRSPVLSESSARKVTDVASAQKRFKQA